MAVLAKRCRAKEARAPGRRVLAGLRRGARGGKLFREPDASLILGLSRGTFYSVFLVAAGLFLILRKPRPAVRS